MKTFLRDIIKFFSLLFVLIFIIDLSTSSIINKKSIFKLTSNPKYIIFGHSHPECAYNDSLIKNFKNLAQSGESYYYTYFKAKKILEQNNSIEVVFIEYTNNQITPMMDEWTWGDVSLSNRYPIYSPFIPFTDLIILLQKNPHGFVNSFSYSNKEKLLNIIRTDYNFIDKTGGYFYLIRNKTDLLLKNKKTSTLKTNKISEINLLYLNKTLDLIKSHKKEVFLVRSPQHQEYKGFENEFVYRNILHNHFNDVKYLDFTNFNLKNSEFGDLEHLNHSGAKVFSIWFNNLIENGLLLENNKQEFIDRNIKINEPLPN